MPGPILLLLGIVGYVVYRRKGRPGARTFHAIGALVGWGFVGICVVFAAILVALAFRSAPPVGKVAMLSVVAAGGLAWTMRQRAAQRSPERVARIDRVAFVGAYAVYAGVA